MNQSIFKIAAIQMSMTADRQKNIDHALLQIEKAAGKGARVICLPELYSNLYFCQKEESRHFDLAESIPGPSTLALTALARKLEVVIVAPIFEKRAAGIYHNSAMVIDADGTMVGHYRKMHIPDDPGYYEKFYFSPGDLGFKCFQTRYGSIAVLICWDQWFPEAARLAALQGAHLLFYPTAIGWLPEERDGAGKTQLEAWQTVQRGHAVANGLYVAAVNRCGLERDGDASIEFWGHSFICGPQGEWLTHAGQEEEILLADVDVDHLEQVRRDWPFFRDRRIDAYQGLNQRWAD